MKFEKNLMLRGKATLSLWFEPSHDYVCPAVTEPINEPVGLFLGRKLKISHEKNVKEFQFYISMQNFRLLGSIIKKKYPKVADPLKECTVWAKNCLRTWQQKHSGKHVFF